MLKIFKVHSITPNNFVGKGDYINENSLTNFIFSGFKHLENHTLTQFRLIDNNGKSICFEFKKGFIIGIELINFNLTAPTNLDCFVTIENTLTELPLHSFELDGTNTKCELNVYTIEQSLDLDFDLQLSPQKDRLEIIFDCIHSASRFGDIVFYYNNIKQLAGFKLLNLNVLIHNVI